MLAENTDRFMQYFTSLFTTHSRQKITQIQFVGRKNFSRTRLQLDIACNPFKFHQIGKTLFCVKKKKKGRS